MGGVVGGVVGGVLGGVLGRGAGVGGVAVGCGAGRGGVGGVNIGESVKGEGALGRGCSLINERLGAVLQPRDIRQMQNVRMNVVSKTRVGHE